MLRRLPAGRTSGPDAFDLPSSTEAVLASREDVPFDTAVPLFSFGAWAGTTALPDVAEVAGLKDRFNDIHVIGSGDLARSLLEADLVDRLNLFLYPLTFGSGKRLFADGSGVPAAFRLAQPPQGFPKGSVALVYERAGAPVTGIDISQV
ncbi:dihydrofolate reductase family protein [Paenarthrobacter sp. NPDC092416]|uniref:dihydrofolate reductase family protein n=1 Tax=Paenarthrobacter sp. NPDC092416 TaxID=3364386 RepID=UPI00382CAC1D